MTAATDPGTAGPRPSASTANGAPAGADSGADSGPDVSRTGGPAADGTSDDTADDMANGDGNGSAPGAENPLAGDPAEVAAERIREASKELITAARKLLDAAEEALEDPQRVARTIRSGTGLVEDLLDRLGRFGSHARSPGRDASAEPGPPRVTQIPLD